MNEIMTKQLDSLRTNIDEIDEQLLDLLAQRAEHVLEVGRVKHANKLDGSFIRSGREAKMMRKLLEKGAGEFPKEALFSIWRSLISASLRMEGGLTVVMPRSKSFNMHNLISEYFGTFTDFAQCDTIPACLDAIKGHTVGVLNANDDWWTLDLKDLRVFAKIHDEMFALAKIVPEKTGEDKTLIVSKNELPEVPHIATMKGCFLYEIRGYYTDVKDLPVEGEFRVLGSYA